VGAMNGELCCHVLGRYLHQPALPGILLLMSTGLHHAPTEESTKK